MNDELEKLHGAELETLRRAIDGAGRKLAAASAILASIVARQNALAALPEEYRK